MPKQKTASTSRTPAKATRKSLTKEQKEVWKRHCEAAQWREDKWFKHPEGTATITKTDAKKLMVTPRLTDLEIGTLPYQSSTSAAGYPMKLYSMKAINELIKKRCELLGVPSPPLSTPVRKAGPKRGSSPFVGIVSGKGLFNDPIYDRLDDPEKLDAVIRREYVPPPGVSEDDPDPKSIRFESGQITRVALKEHDACLLYCLQRKDLDILRTPSGWFDLVSVEVRALEVHGGLKKHNQIVIEQRLQDAKAIDAYMEKYHRGLETPLRSYSPDLERFLNKMSSDDEWHDLDPIRSETKEEKRRKVYQFHPIRKEDIGDYGCEWMWFHGCEMVDNFHDP
ncbi:hypothetical protein CC2G_004107 [Coprinopsis cinerea AmutBmut pab1-1]|nr:hypothetical protein CC2G_004107 [Coprinopsis cinerea AmutBmut pab1-1]